MRLSIALLVALLTASSWAQSWAQTSSRELTIPGPYKLGATLQYPKAANKAPGVVLMHGSGPNNRNSSMPLGTFGIHPFKHLSRELSKRGIVVLRYDKRTHYMRENNLVKDVASVLPLDFADDAAAACDLLRTQPEVDAERVFLIAHSQGGTLAPWVAERTKLRALVMLAPGLLPLSEQVEYQLQYQLEFLNKKNTFGMLNSKIAEAEKIGEQYRALFKRIASGEVKSGEMVGGASLEFYQESDRTGREAVRKMAQLKIPTLLVNGTADLKCPAPLLESKEKELTANPNLEIIYRKGMVHELYTERYRAFDEGLAELLADWILKR